MYKVMTRSQPSQIADDLRERTVRAARTTTNLRENDS